MTEEPNNLQRAMEAAVTERTQPNEVERLIATGDRMLRAQQAKLTAATSEYEQRRTERLNFYRSEMQRLADEAEHELLLLDRDWYESCRKIGLVIGKLKAMRGA